MKLQKNALRAMLAFALFFTLGIGVSAGGGALVVLIGALIWRSRKKKASKPAR